MAIKYYVIDAFADSVFKGNPAGVCIVDKELDDITMQNIAAENNLSETAFVTKHDGYYGLRWFTPTVEVNLCGHATLASAFVITNFVDTNATQMEFKTKSGLLTVKKKADLYELNFPSNKPKQVEATTKMQDAIGVSVLEAYAVPKILVLLVDNEEQVKNIVPDLNLIGKLSDDAVIVTAKGDSVDFVSRFFAPNIGITEDPVTGSAHTILAPLWSEKLLKDEMVAKQVSKRGGTLFCRDCGDRVKIAGKGVLYLEGEIVV